MKLINIFFRNYLFLSLVFFNSMSCMNEDCNMLEIEKCEKLSNYIKTNTWKGFEKFALYKNNKVIQEIKIRLDSVLFNDTLNYPFIYNLWNLDCINNQIIFIGLPSDSLSNKDGVIRDKYKILKSENNELNLEFKSEILFDSSYYTRNIEFVKL